MKTANGFVHTALRLGSAFGVESGILTLKCVASLQLDQACLTLGDVTVKPTGCCLASSVTQHYWDASGVK